MIIKNTNLQGYLKNQMAPIYFLLGLDHFLLNESAQAIKTAWISSTSDYENHIIYINNAGDWSLAKEQLSNRGLFSSKILVDIRYEKKTFDAAAHQFIQQYLSSINSTCLLLIRAPQLPLKQLTNYHSLKEIHIIQVFSLDAKATQQWIKGQLEKRAISYDSQAPSLIYRYTQGNLLATAQAVERIEMALSGNYLTLDMIKEQLVDQSNFQLFELSDSYLSQNLIKVISQLRFFQQSNTEPSLVLWFIAQDIRYLIQLKELTEQAMPLEAACKKLKIWPSRSRLYQLALNHLSMPILKQLLAVCKIADDKIKSNQGPSVWHSFEQIALTLCIGKQADFFA